MKYNSNDDIIKMLNYYIDKADITKAQLARKLGMTPQNLNALFSKKNINLNDIKRIADALGLDIEINLVEKKKRILGQKEEDLRESEQEQRRLMDNATRGIGAVEYKGAGDMEALAMAIEDIYKRLDKLDRKRDEEE